MIDILLATYNGARFLPAQLDSLLAQTVKEWCILARDDHSADETMQILQRFRAEHPEHISIIEDQKGRLGAAGNFAALLAATDAPYIMFCDQDDVWYPEKIRRSLVALQALEGMDGAHVPAMVHTDARVTDAELHPIAPSFHRLQKLHPQHASLKRLLVQNVAHGCTIMLNRALARIPSPIPKEARIHDHWVALVAAACGLIGCIETPMLDYRQHGGNAIGARKRSLDDLRRSVQNTMRHNFLQGSALAGLVSHMPPEAADTLARFMRISTLPQAIRGPALVMSGFLRRPLYQNIPVFYFA